LRLLTEAGLLERTREGVNAWYVLAQGDMGGLARDVLRRADTEDPVLAADRRGAARVLAERAREASEKFRRAGADWDEMRALDLPAAEVEAALLSLLGDARLGRALDVGTGTGRLLELLAPRLECGLGIDASRTMLALARVRLAKPEFSNLSVRLADMYALPLHDAAFDTVLLQMVLHYAEDPAQVIAEAARVLAPGGRLVIVDLAAHDRADLRERLAHRALGFSDEAVDALVADAGLRAVRAVSVPGPLSVRIWCCAETSTPRMPVSASDAPSVLRRSIEEESSFLKKRSKRLLPVGFGVACATETKLAKVFWFFFSKKNIFLFPPVLKAA
jgi:ArsR family transcriptional regulator